MQSWKKIFKDYIQKQKSADSAHDTDHVQRVVINAEKFAQLENADLEIVIPAAWLHDCVAVSKDSSLRNQASKLSAEKAEQLLKEWNYPLENIDAIKHAIEAHSYSANIKPLTLEAKIVQDADRIDSIESEEQLLDSRFSLMSLELAELFAVLFEIFPKS